MSISLIVIRIVLAKTSNQLENKIDFIAPKYQDMSTNLPEGSTSTDDENLKSLRESHDITIEQYTDLTEKRNDPDEQKTNVTSPTSLNQLPFHIGNHFVEVIQGVLHLYKENKLTTLSEEAERSNIICMLSVNTSKTIHDILQFTAPFNQDIQHIQIIRDSNPSQYMVLLKFASQRSADEFYNSLNGTPFNSIELDVCHLVYIAKIEVIDDSKTANLPISGFTELPTCPVCLERMDESVQGILTILCNHSFHGKCLDQWYDSSCPICRYCMTPEQLADNRCSECGSQSSAQDTLWICLICGHIGCGRYVEGHAYKHYKDTQHTYAMQLGLNNRVWDYAGDNYVHRLLQNKDGEPVELKANNSSNQIMQDEKIDAVQLEYTYLLTNQLENQRHFYEENMTRLEKEKQSLIDELFEKNRFLNEDNNSQKEELNNLKKSKQQLEKKISQLSQKISKIQSNLTDEKELNKCLRNNQEEWSRRLVETEKSLKEIRNEKDAEINDLKEQIRDLMLFLDAKEKLQNVPNTSTDEIENSQIYIQQQSPSTSKSKSTKNKKTK